MDILEVPQNYNYKLFNDIFGVVVPHAPYQNIVGNIFSVKCKTVEMGIVKVVAVRTFHSTNITDALSYLEIGKPASYLAAMVNRYHDIKVAPKTMLDHVICQYTQRNMEAHQVLLQDWWNALIENTSTNENIFN